MLMIGRQMMRTFAQEQLGWKDPLLLKIYGQCRYHRIPPSYFASHSSVSVPTRLSLLTRFLSLHQNPQPVVQLRVVKLQFKSCISATFTWINSMKLEPAITALNQSVADLTLLLTLPEITNTLPDHMAIRIATLQSALRRACMLQ